MTLVVENIFRVVDVMTIYFVVAEKELIQYSDVKFTTYFLDIFLVTGKYISVMKYTMEISISFTEILISLMETMEIK